MRAGVTALPAPVRKGTETNLFFHCCLNLSSLRFSRSSRQYLENLRQENRENMQDNYNDEYFEYQIIKVDRKQSLIRIDKFLMDRLERTSVAASERHQSGLYPGRRTGYQVQLQSTSRDGDLYCHSPVSGRGKPG